MKNDEIDDLFARATQWLAEGAYVRAETAYRAILSTAPHHRPSVNNLAACLFGLKRYAEALQCFSWLAQIEPQDALAHYNAGRCLRELGDIDQAMRAYRQALTLRPDYREARENLANLLAERGRPDEALPLYVAGIAQDPGRPDNYRQAALQLRERGAPGDIDAAGDLLEKAIALRVQDADALRLIRAMLMSPIAASGEEIGRWRQQLADALAELERSPLSIRDPLHEIGIVPFFLAYHGEQDKWINASLSRVLRQACPALEFRRPGLASGRRSKPRIGIVTACAGEHTTARYFSLSLAALAEYAEVRTYYVGQEWRQQFDANSLPATGWLPNDLNACHAALAAEALDILIYPEVGIHPLPWLLAHARLAPVQIALYGQPVTTGNPGIDYFLSHAGSEPPDPAGDYTEQLLLLPSDVSAACIAPRGVDVPRRTRADFGLSESRRLYLCAQALFKIHPDFDALLAELLRRDPDGELLLFAMRGHWGERVLARLHKAAPFAVGRIRMLPFLPLAEFMALAACCDVALDTPQFSGGGTSYDCLQACLPIVTLPGRFMRARQTATLYKRLKIETLTAKDAEEYLQIALRLAHDASEQRQVRQQIQAGHARLYNDRLSAEAFCQLILQAQPRATAGYDRA